MKKTKDSAKIMYDMFKFQYAPIEKMLEREYPEIYAKYLKYDYWKKIRFIDIVAGKLGL